MQGVAAHGDDPSILGRSETAHEPSGPSSCSDLGEETCSVLSGDDSETASGSMVDAATSTRAAPSHHRPNKLLRGKHVLLLILLPVLVFLSYERVAVAPEDRLIPPGATDRLLEWVQEHPRTGLVVMWLCLTIAPLTLAPVTGPLGMGLGYICTAAYGWSLGYPLAAAVVYCGTVTGACACFLAGRHLLQDRVRQWIRGNQLLEAVDVASAESGFKMMAMLELAPLPLGPLCYVCGTTSMTFAAFCLAKVFALPRTLLLVFAGASATTLLDEGDDSEEHNKVLLVICLVCAGIAIGVLGHNIQKELVRILERQRHQKHNANMEMEPLGGL